MHVMKLTVLMSLKEGFWHNDGALYNPNSLLTARAMTES